MCCGERRDRTKVPGRTRSRWTTPRISRVRPTAVESGETGREVGRKCNGNVPEMAVQGVSNGYQTDSLATHLRPGWRS